MKTRYRIVLEFPIQGDFHEEVGWFAGRGAAVAHAANVAQEWRDAGIDCRPLHVAEMLRLGA